MLLISERARMARVWKTNQRTQWCRVHAGPSEHSWPAPSTDFTSDARMEQLLEAPISRSDVWSRKPPGTSGTSDRQKSGQQAWRQRDKRRSLSRSVTGAQPDLGKKAFARATTRAEVVRGAPRMLRALMTLGAAATHRSIPGPTTPGTRNTVRRAVRILYVSQPAAERSVHRDQRGRTTRLLVWAAFEEE